MPRLALNTATVSGDLDARLAAAVRAGFAGVGIWEADFRAYPGGSSAAARRVAACGLAVPEAFTLRDWQLRPDAAHAEAQERARAFFEWLAALSYPMAVVVGAVESGPLEVAARQLGEICDLAAPYGVRLAYELFAWGNSFSTFRDGYEMVRRANRENVGLVIDTFHFFLSGSTLRDLEAAAVEAIAVVHLADAPESTLDVVSLCRHHRVYPGEGRLPVRELVAVLERKAYAGWYCLELFNDEYARQDSVGVAEAGIASMRQLF